MVLHFSVISPEGEERCHTFFDRCIDTHLCLLNHLVRVGYQLQLAYLVDDSNRINFPIEAFDGEEIKAMLQEMELEYNHILCS